MTQTNGISNANILNTALGATQRADTARTAVIRAAASETAAVQNGSSTTRFSDLGSVLAAAAPDTSDVRADKVAALKSAIESGSYKVSASAVADKLISELLG